VLGSESDEAEQPNSPADWGAGAPSARFWSMVVLTGIGAGLGADGLMAVLHLVQHLAYGYHTGRFQPAVERDSDTRRVVVLTIGGVLMGFSWFLLRRRESKDSVGLSESIWEKEGRLPLFSTLVNAVLQILAVGFGASLGREGAPKEAGAGIASSLADWSGLSPSQRRLLVACGAGAGMAAVYNVPLGGALFALEVFLGTLTLPLVLPALATASIATAVSWIGLPNRPVYHLPSSSFSVSEIVWALLFGPLAGLIAVGYIRLFSWAKTARPKGPAVIASITVVFSGLGFLAIAYPQVLGNGLDLTQLVFLGALSVPLLAILLVLKPLATAMCFKSGAAGGLFTPTLTFGALLGGLLGHLWLLAWPGAPVTSFAVIGGAAVLAATMQAPLAATALVLELTSASWDLAVPLLLCVVLASLVARILDRRSIYTAPLGRHEHGARLTPGVSARSADDPGGTPPPQTAS